MINRLMPINGRFKILDITRDDIGLCDCLGNYSVIFPLPTTSMNNYTNNKTIIDTSTRTIINMKTFELSFER